MASSGSQGKTQENSGSAFSCDVPKSVRDSCYEYRGVVMPNFMSLRCMKALENFEVRPDDTFIITYPKSGTTWLQQITLLVNFDGDASQMEGKHITQLSPFLDEVDLFTSLDIDEAPLVADQAKELPSPRILKSHCLTNWLPAEIRTDDPKVKVIYVVRNPKDTAASYYNFCQFIGPLPSYESWDVFFEEFLAGRAPQGSWFENVLPWWRRRNHPNVLFLKYEDMKKDLGAAVKQIAQFMGKSFSDDVIDRIVEASTFSAMKKSKSANPDSVIASVKNVTKKEETKKSEMKKSEGSFMRKGAIGDWKNYFSAEQNRRFDELYAKEMAGSGLELQFE
ncbi:sulfotransferase 1C2-like [Diadema antillarum]|uniref:sulfotransferase 1C2-like n=1 Tax=Diadema antillarum TaxID=105358 RepID=UPI003A83D190